jgi:hypothetical protein
MADETKIQSFWDENLILITGLLVTLGVVVIGWVTLVAFGKTVPEGFTALATAIVGGLIGYLVPKRVS